MKRVQVKKEKFNNEPVQWLDEKDSKIGFFKVNENFSIPSIAINITFKVADTLSPQTDSTKDLSSAITEDAAEKSKIKSQALSHIIADVWNTRLRKISNQISFSRAAVGVKVSLDTIELFVVAPEEIFERVIENVVSMINISGSQLAADEIAQAKITTMRFMKGNSSTIKKAVSNYDSLIIKQLKNNEKILNFYQNSKLSETQFEKPIIQYLFLEGDTSQSMAKRYAGKFFDQFQRTSKPWELPLIQNFNHKNLRIYRA
jgi:hypothetical protein